MAANKLFAIKDAMDVKITANGAAAAALAVAGVSERDVPTPLMEITYANDCSLSKTSEVTYAKKKGANAVAFNSAPTGTFTINSEFATLNWLGLSLGGKVEGKKVSVTSVAPATTYTIEGKFRCTGDDGKEEVKIIKFPNAKPQANCELSFGAENVASFALTFDLMVDSKGLLMEIDDAPDGSLGVGMLEESRATKKAEK